MPSEGMGTETQCQDLVWERLQYECFHYLHGQTASQIGLDLSYFGEIRISLQYLL